MKITFKILCILISITLMYSFKNQETPDKLKFKKDCFKTESEFEHLNQNIALFDLWIFETSQSQKVGFISLSDIDRLSDHLDSNAIPDIKGMKSEELEYLSLNSVYRKRFLNRTKISESDTVFIYDYYSNILQRIAVCDLTVCASLSAYADAEENAYSQYDYQIGFEIANTYLDVNEQKISSYCYTYVGKENPFVQGEMYPIQWQKIRLDEFPEVSTSVDERDNLKGQKAMDAYKFISTEWHYYLKHFVSDSYASRLLVVKSAKNNNTVYIKFFRDSEFVEYAPLNCIDNSDSQISYQFAGRLLKQKPPVIFGLQYHSAGCPNIFCMDENDLEIEINCDNRH